jgi:sec-independent protein translocase protein TatA
MAHVTLAAFGFGGSELLIILAIMLLLFGGSKLPSLAKGLGQSVKEFKKASNTDDEPKPEEPKKVTTPPSTPPGSN